MTTIQRFPRPYRFPRKVEFHSIEHFRKRAKKYGIPFDEYREDADGRPGRWRNGVGRIPLRFPRSRHGSKS